MKHWISLHEISDKDTVVEICHRVLGYSSSRQRYVKGVSRKNRSLKSGDKNENIKYVIFIRTRQDIRY